ncbi:MAG TPA: DUF3107 domain-containing protein [Streptosporangiaceae bacterium]
MEVRIGVQSAPRELDVETSTSADQIEQDLADALADNGVFVLTVEKGGKVLVPADKIAYLEFIGAEARPIGFGN